MYEHKRINYSKKCMMPNCNSMSNLECGFCDYDCINPETTTKEG